jgi:membrane-bound ClpP family serine protease
MRGELREAFNRPGAFLLHPSSLVPPSFLSSLIPQFSSVSLILLVLGAIFIVACLIVAAMSRHQKSASRPLRLEGQVGVVLEALEPEGAVLVDGELWRARSLNGDRIVQGRVRIVGARGHWLEVESIA